MRKMILAAALVLGFTGAAAADTRKDATISVSSGVYDWNHETVVSGVPIREKNRECLIPEKASILLSKLVSDLDSGCKADQIKDAADGFTFKLVCTGKYPGSADATLKSTPQSLSITAKGNARVGGVPSDLKMSATATRVGDCTPAQLAEGRKKLASGQ